jgi:hypothetical protein
MDLTHKNIWTLCFEAALIAVETFGLGDVAFHHPLL